MVHEVEHGNVILGGGADAGGDVAVDGRPTGRPASARVIITRLNLFLISLAPCVIIKLAQHPSAPDTSYDPRLSVLIYGTSIGLESSCTSAVSMSDTRLDRVIDAAGRRLAHYHLLSRWIGSSFRNNVAVDRRATYHKRGETPSSKLSFAGHLRHMVNRPV